MAYQIHDHTEAFTLTTETVETNERRKANRSKYKNVVCAFDIETTRLDNDQSILYIWMFAIGDHDVYIGRTWKELEFFLDRITKQINDGEKLVILVHNLSYEFCFLRTIYDFQPDEVFALKSRKIAKCTMFDKKLEFRCTYIHSNMSLAQYTKKMNVEHRKLSGDDYDYSIKRYPDTPMTDEEIRYCCHDVIGLVEAYQTEMKLDGDTLATVPMTSTGYVRRECRKAMQLYSHKAIMSAQPDADRYLLMKESFRGGDTHASRFYAGQILTDVKSADRSSSYPDVMCNDDFPYGQGIWQTNVDRKIFNRFMTAKHHVFFARVILRNVKLKDKYWGFPYLPLGKCTRFSHDYLIDNGRILSAGALEIALTNIDMRIIEETYTFNLEVKEMLIFPCDKLPEPLIETTQMYYKDKTELKGIPEQQVFYDKQKAKLNSLYGMCATDPVRMEFMYDENHENLFSIKPKNIEDTLRINRTKNFLLYQWGCFVTAWARYRLYEAIKIAGDNAVYCDTDSVKYVGDCSFDSYNRIRESCSKSSGSFATDKHGVTHYMGVYEQEQTYKRFITYGAKKYAYEYADRETHVTISGVNKIKGGEELHKRGGLEALKEGFVFREGGGVELIYNDHTPRQTITVDGHTFEIGANVCIKPSTYTLSTTADYKEVLANPYLLDKVLHKFGYADL